MATSEDMLDLVVAAVRGPDADADPPVFATSAGADVYSPGDWPAQGGQYPIWKIRVVREIKVSLGRSGPPEFTVTTTVRAVGEVSAPVAVKDAGAAAAQAALWQLKQQFEAAVINSYPLMSQIQQIPTVESQLSYNSEAETHLAGIQIDLGLEFYQGPEDFAPVTSTPVLEIHGSFTDFPGNPGFTDTFQQ